MKELVDELVKQVQEIENRELQSLAYLYMKETGLKVSEIEMVRVTDGSQVSFHFRPLTCFRCNPCVCAPEN